jgi:putative resolvase
MKYKKLSEYAKDNGISYITAYRHYKKGLLDDCKQLDTGTILVGYNDTEINYDNHRAIVYSRVSSNEMKENLNRQQERLEQYAISKGYTIVKSIKEISSGMIHQR